MNEGERIMVPSGSQSFLSDLFPLEEFYARREGNPRIMKMSPDRFDKAVKLCTPQSGTQPASGSLGEKLRKDRTAGLLLWTSIEGSAVPEPYRSLLVHGSDMTSTLEKFHGETLQVELMSRHTKGQEYYREVVLRLAQSGRRAEFGAIKIMLDLVPDEVRQEILRERNPFGRILTEFGIEFSSRPRAFLRLISDDFINTTLDLKDSQLLYGRCNTLVDPWNQPLAEIVEILPPV
jgi:hypothetical protein